MAETKPNYRELIPIEERKYLFYKEQSDKLGDCTDKLNFILEQLKDRAAELSEVTSAIPAAYEEKGTLELNIKKLEREYQEKTSEMDADIKFLRNRLDTINHDLKFKETTLESLALLIEQSEQKIIDKETHLDILNEEITKISIKDQKHLEKLREEKKISSQTLKTLDEEKEEKEKYLKDLEDKKVTAENIALHDHLKDIKISWN